MVGRGQRLAGRDHHRSVHARRDVHHRRAGDAVVDEHARVVRSEGKGHRLAWLDVPEGRAGRHPSRVKIERVRHRPAVVKGDLHGLTLPHVQNRSRHLSVERPGAQAHPGRDLDRAILDRDREASNRALDGRRQACRERHERPTSLHALGAPETIGRRRRASRRPQQGARRESAQAAEQHAPAGLRRELRWQTGGAEHRSALQVLLVLGRPLLSLLDFWPASTYPPVWFVSVPVCVPILLKTFGSTFRRIARIRERRATHRGVPGELFRPPPDALVAIISTSPPAALRHDRTRAAGGCRCGGRYCV